MKRSTNKEMERQLEQAWERHRANMDLYNKTNDRDFKNLADKWFTLARYYEAQLQYRQSNILI